MNASVPNGRKKSRNFQFQSAQAPPLNRRHRGWKFSGNAIDASENLGIFLEPVGVVRRSDPELNVGLGPKGLAFPKTMEVGSNYALTGNVQISSIPMEVGKASAVVFCSLVQRSGEDFLHSFCVPGARCERCAPITWKTGFSACYRACGTGGS